MTRRQKFKGMKRLRSWHRGRSEARNWARVMDLPDLGTGADPAAGSPTPLHRDRGPGRTRARGDAV